MFRLLIFLVALFLTTTGLYSPSFAIAASASRAQPLNAAPLGLELGYANVVSVKEKIGSLTKLSDVGTNQYSGGPMLTSDGQGLDVEGLSSVLFIFDNNQVLAGVVMTMPKSAKETYATLAKKYKPVENKIDGFMDYGYARLSKGDSFIEVDAPHLSFDMEVRYLTKKMMANFKQQSANSNAKKKKKKADQL
jgi:hypothetical protein